ncbi:hypothetical protein C356_05843 [Cryptococcus neoformans c45]|nr:hypothetical protein C356_05843 [Cryptococcus neoformans var. grubii c45]
MPLEVTPAPFPASQRLPYVPAVPRPDSGGGMFPSSASSLGVAGPATAAASAIIPPAPGGVAGPHRAIPALPDAGYTSVNLPGFCMRSQGPSSVYSSSYAGPCSLYDSGLPDPPSYQGRIHSHLPIVRNENWASSSLPASRRGPPAPDSVMAHHRHHHHHHRRHHDHDDDLDCKSDASYYAMPKDKRRSRAGSVSSVPDTEGLNESQGYHRRSRSISQAQTYKPYRSPSLPPGNAHHLHTPISPSPLAVNDDELPGNVGRSVLPPLNVARRPQRMSLPPEEERRPRLQPFVPPEYEDPELRKGKKQDARGGLEAPDERQRRHSSAASEDSVQPHLHRNNSTFVLGGFQTHTRHRSGSHLLPESRYDRSASPPFVMRGPASAVRSPHYLPDIEGNYRKRTVSMQGLERPEHPSSEYQTPSMAGGQVVYDDSASVASDSRMTFEDGAVAGRTSQYGLPQYPHQPKMDYRRFCVQRGNADVFLDY